MYHLTFNLRLKLFNILLSVCQKHQNIFSILKQHLVHHHLKMHSSNSRVELIMSNVFGPGFASKNVDRYSSYPTLAQHNIYKSTLSVALELVTNLHEDFTIKEKAFLLKAPTSFHWKFQLEEGPSRDLLRDYEIFAKISFELPCIHLIWMMTPGVRFLNCSQMMGER